MALLSQLLLAAEKAQPKKFWILDPLYTVLGYVLAWFYGFVGDYGVSIVLLTVAVRILLIPLTMKQIRSMQAMQRLQPEIKRLQQQYKDDRQKLNEETMKFYKENKVNPLSGCLPLLLQMPLFIVLYRLINNLVPKSGSGKVLPPKHIPKDSELFRALLHEAGTMKSWGMDLAERATNVHGLGKAWPYYVLIGFVVFTGWYQQRQTTARQAADGAVNQQAQLMGKIRSSSGSSPSPSRPAWWCTSPRPTSGRSRSRPSCSARRQDRVRRSPPSRRRRTSRRETRSPK